MKKILSIFVLSVVFTACKTKTNTDTANKNMVLVDTTGLSKSSALTDVGGKYVINNKSTAPTQKNNTPPSSAGNEVNNTNNPVSNTVEPAPVKRDKGWSEAAKGTAIGGGSGAIIGAVVNKNDRVAGAVIGSVIGAGTGYVIGRSQDKKSGRVARAKARRKANK